MPDFVQRLLAEASPGPWYVNENDLIGGWAIGTERGPVSGGRSRDNVADFMEQANANLIVAAVEMLRLTSSLVTDKDDGEFGSCY